MTEEVRVTSSTGAHKNKKLAQMSLLPMEALTKVAEHYAIGAKKYEQDHNWRKGYDWSLSFDALMRHATAFWSGEDNDKETKTPHMAAVVFHAMTLLTFMEEQRAYDDRYRPDSTVMEDKRRAEEAWEADMPFGGLANLLHGKAVPHYLVSRDGRIHEAVKMHPLAEGVHRVDPEAK